ncbi:MAG: plastocyanin/azurin family copper-binding protein [Pseudomonadota bacterium]
MKAPTSPQKTDRRRTLVQIGAALLVSSGLVQAADSAVRTNGRPLVQLHITTKGDLLEFSTQALSCKADSRVRLTFVNGARYVDFDHNWVLIRSGTFDAFVAAATQAGAEHGWMPAQHPGMIAATAMAHKGQTVSVEFNAPQVGRYLYICSMPGHSASMWGVFTVTAA